MVAVRFVHRGRSGGYGRLMSAIKPWDLLACLLSVLGSGAALFRLARRH